MHCSTLQESSDKFELIKDGSIRKLVINDVLLQDKGRYVCQTGDNRTKADVSVESK